MRLQLAKKNGLYYADVNDVRAPRVEECNAYSLFTDDWIPVLDAHRSDREVEGAWAVITRQVPVIKALRKLRDRTTHTSLPSLIEDEAFWPLLDPLAEREWEWCHPQSLIKRRSQWKKRRRRRSHGGTRRLGLPCDGRSRRLSNRNQNYGRPDLDSADGGSSRRCRDEWRECPSRSVDTRSASSITKSRQQSRKGQQRARHCGKRGRAADSTWILDFCVHRPRTSGDLARTPTEW